MPCNLISQRYALQKVRDTLNVLRKVGYGEGSEPFQKVLGLRNEMRASLGIKIPKPMSLLKLLAGLSPGSVKLWFDSDTGWFTEARVKDGTPPVYHHVDDDTAMTILGGKMTHELEAVLMKPDEYQGE